MIGDVIHRDGRGRIELVNLDKSMVRYLVTYADGSEIWTNTTNMAHDLLAKKKGPVQLTLFDIDDTTEELPD